MIYVELWNTGEPSRAFPWPWRFISLSWWFSNFSRYHSHLEACEKHLVLRAPPPVSEASRWGWGLVADSSNMFPGLLMLLVWRPPWEPCREQHSVRGQLLPLLVTVSWDDFRFRNLKCFPPPERKTGLTWSCLSRPAEECPHQRRVEICFLSPPVFLTRLRWMVIQGGEKIWKMQVKTR